MRANFPVPRERIHVGGGDTALQVALYVLDVLRFLTIDIARKIEVEFVLLNFLKAHHAGVLGILDLLGEDVNDPVDILLAQSVLRTVLHEALAGIDQKDALARLGALLVDGDDAGGDASAVKEVGGQADDALDVALADEVPTDVSLDVAAK